MSTLGSLGKAVGPALQRAAPSMVQGASTGAAAGPYGALIGAGLGLVSSLASQPGAPSRTGTAPSSARHPRSSDDCSGTTHSHGAGAGRSACDSCITNRPGCGSDVPVLITESDHTTGLAKPGSWFLRRRTGVDSIGEAMSREERSIIWSSQLLANASEGLPESESIVEQNYLRAENGEILNRSCISRATRSACTFSCADGSSIRCGIRVRRFSGDRGMDV